MPEVNLNTKPEMSDVKSIPARHFFTDNDGSLYLRTDDGAVFLGGGTSDEDEDYPTADHHKLSSSLLKEYGPYTDLGMLTVKR